MKRSSSWIAVLPSLVIPVCLGLTMYLGLSYLIDAEFITNEKVLRYLTGHPVSKVTVAMFFIGLASLLMIASNVFGQFNGEKKITLDTPVDEEAVEADRADSLESLDAKDQAVELASRLNTLPKSLQTHYLWQRLQSALHSIFRTNSTAGVEEELKYLSELDLDQQQQRYSLVRILIWATPMLGFLGTVLGISQALGGINVGADNNFQTMMDGLRGSLYIAFDTTALALTLSMFLMFLQFLVDRFESQLLLLVDQRAQSEINRSVPLMNAAGVLDGKSLTPMDAMNAMTESITSATAESSKQQTEIWRKTILAAQETWASTLTDANMQVHANMSEAIDENVASLAHYLGESIEKADLAMSHRWQQWQVTLSENARVLQQHHKQLAEQTMLLQDLMAGTSANSNTPRVDLSSTVVSDQLSSVEIPPRSAEDEMKLADAPAVQNSGELKVSPPPAVATISQIEKPQPPIQLKPAKKLTPKPKTEVVFNVPVQTQKEPVTGVPEVVAFDAAKPKQSEPKVALPSEAVVAKSADEPRIINFQAFLDSTLAKAKSLPAVGEKLPHKQEILLPFSFGDKNGAEGSSDQIGQSNGGKLKKSA